MELRKIFKKTKKMNDRILDKYKEQYIRIYMKDVDEEGIYITETGYLRDYDTVYVEMEYPQFLQKCDWVAAERALIPRDNMRYIDILSKDAYAYHEKIFTEDMEKAKESVEVVRKQKHQHSNIRPEIG